MGFEGRTWEEAKGHLYRTDMYILHRGIDFLTTFCMGVGGLGMIFELN